MHRTSHFPRRCPTHPPTASRRAQSRRPTCTGRAGAGGGKDRAQEPRNKPPEAGRTAPAGQGTAETARPPWGRSLARQDRPPPLDKARAVSEEYGPAFKALTVRQTQGAHSHEDPRLGRQGPGRAVRAHLPAQSSMSRSVRSPITVSPRAPSSPPFHALPAHQVLAIYPVSSFNDLTFSFQMVPSLLVSGNVNRKWGCCSPSAAAIVPVTDLGQLRPNQKPASSETESPCWVSDIKHDFQLTLSGALFSIGCVRQHPPNPGVLARAPEPSGPPACRRRLTLPALPAWLRATHVTSLSLWPRLENGGNNSNR